MTASKQWAGEMIELPKGFVPANDAYTNSPYNDPRVYIYGIKCGDLIKVGIAKSVAKRLKGFRLANPQPMEVVFKRHAYQAFAIRIERAMHEYLKEFAVGREWFRCTVEDVKAASRHAKINFHEVRRNLKRNDARWGKKFAAETLEEERISNDNGL
ncbi:MAG: GIY-YIG nuclease family protein [Aestuariivirga sp.]|nr:GIY-YIG nuclease family protein [Aestuariivirga sp.]